MPYSPVTLTVAPYSAEQVLVQIPALANSSTAVLVFPSRLASSGLLTPLPLAVASSPPTQLLLNLPGGDGVYTLQAIRVLAQEGARYELGTTLGEVRLDYDDNRLYQYQGVDLVNQVGIWTSQVDYDLFFSLPGISLGPTTYTLHTGALTSTYYQLLLKTLEEELGPSLTHNEVQVRELTRRVGVVERGLAGAGFLMGAGKYLEAARTLELLSLTRYLPYPASS